VVNKGSMLGALIKPFKGPPYSSADEAVRLVNCNRYDFAVFVPATSVEEVKDIAENGLCMPPKSTYFHRKALTGLVFHKYA